MTDFQTSAAVTVELDSGSLRDARSTLEDELSSDPITVSVDSGKTAMADGGQRTGGLSSLRDGVESLTTLADDRNTILGEMLEALDAQAFEDATGDGGGGGNKLLTLGLGALGGAGGSLGAGALSSGASALGSLFGKGKSAAGRIPGGAGGKVGRLTKGAAEFTPPAIGPEISKQFDKFSKMIGGGGFLPDGSGQFGKGSGGTAPSGGSTTLMMSSPERMNQLLNFEWPEPPSLPSFSWPDPPDLPELSWPEVPDPFAGLSWPEAPDPLSGIDWPNPPDPLSGTDWPDPPNPFAQLNWPDVPDPFAGIDWPDPPDPFAGFDWPDPPDLAADISVDLSGIGRDIQQHVEEYVRRELGLR